MTDKVKLFADGFHLVKQPTQTEHSVKGIISKQLTLIDKARGRPAPLIQIDASGSSFSQDRSSPGKESSYFPASGESKQSWRPPVERQSSRRSVATKNLQQEVSPSQTQYSRQNTSGKRLSRFAQPEVLSPGLGPGLSSLNSISSRDSMESESMSTENRRLEKNLAFDESFTASWRKSKRYKRRLKKLDKSFNFEEIDKHLFRNHNEYIRFILDKDPSQRSPGEVMEVVKVLQSIKFFQERQISDSDLADLALYFKVVANKAGEEAVSYGEKGDDFFIILMGMVEVLVPNNKIAAWRHERFRFQQEQRWKQDIDERYKRSLNLDLQKRATVKRKTSLMNEKIRQSVLKSQISTKRKDSFNSSVLSRNDHFSGEGDDELSPMISQDDEEEVDLILAQTPGLKTKNTLRLPDGEKFGFIQHSSTVLGNKNASRLSLASPSGNLRMQSPDIFTRLGLSQEEIRRYNRVVKAEKNEPQWFIPVVQLGPGNSFGEIALLNNTTRTATVKCLEESVFAVIDRFNYEKVLGSIEQRNLLRKTQFFGDLAFLRNWTKNQIQKIIHSFYERKVKKHEAIIRQGQDSDSIFIIKEGEFEVVRSSRVKCSIFKQSTSKEDERALFHRVKDKSMKPVFSLPSRCTVQKFELKKVCAGQMVGESDVMLNRPYTTTVSCSSVTGTVYSIQKNEFINKFSKDDALWKGLLKVIAEQDNTLIKQIKAAVKTRSKRVNDAQQAPDSPEVKKSVQIFKPAAVIEDDTSSLGDIPTPEGSRRGSQVSCERDSEHSFIQTGPQPRYSKTEATSRVHSPSKRLSQASVVVQNKHVRYLEILKQNQMRLTKDRLDDFRSTLMEIVDVKNGLTESDFAYNKSVVDRSSQQSFLNQAANTQPSPLPRVNNGRYKSYLGGSVQRGFTESVMCPNKRKTLLPQMELNTSSSPDVAAALYHQSVAQSTNATQISIIPSQVAPMLNKQEYVQSRTDFTREMSTHNDNSPTTAGFQGLRNLPGFDHLESEAISRNGEPTAMINFSNLSAEGNLRKMLLSQQQSRTRPKIKMLVSSQNMTAAQTRNPSRTFFHSRGRPSPVNTSFKNLTPMLPASPKTSKGHYRPTSQMESSMNFSSFFGDAGAFPSAQGGPTQGKPSPVRLTEPRTTKASTSAIMQQKIELLKKMQKGKAIACHHQKRAVRRSVAATWLGKAS